MIENDALNIVDLSLKQRRAVFKFSNRGLVVRLFLTCWIVFSLHFATNTVREIYPALSLANNFSFDVSEYQGLHPDIFVFKDRGAFINNNPGASMMGAIPYFVSRPITDRIISRIKKSRANSPAADVPQYDTKYPMAQEFYRLSRENGWDIKFGLGAGIMQAFCMAPISALGVVVMYLLLVSLTRQKGTALLLSLLYAFATPVFFRTGQLNQNLLLTHFALFSFALLWQPWIVDRVRRKPFYFLAGLCAGWTVVLDYSGLVALLALSGYALSIWLSNKKEERSVAGISRFATGVLICGAIIMAYQWSSFGNPILPAQSYMPDVAYTGHGYRGFSFPSPDLLLRTAFDMRFGLFVSSPILLFVFAFPVWLRKKSRILELRETVFVTVFIALFFLFCSANQYGFMQFNTGVRHILPVLPFLFLLTANVLLKLPKLILLLTGVLTTYWSWCLVMYRDVEQGLGVLESIRHISLEGFRLPWLTTLEKMGFVENGSVLPLFFVCGTIIWIIWKVGGNDRDASQRYL